MYYKDLTDYQYIDKEDAKNIGWLDVAIPYKTGQVPDEFLDRLWLFLRYPVYVCRGFHVCNLCNSADKGMPIAEHNNIRRRIGYYEIRVWGNSGVKYAAPSLLFHYITAHHYQPPQEFMNAVLQCPEPGSEEYKSLLFSLKDADDFWWREDRMLED